MPRYVAFLRAVNVGGRVVKMERLRQVFEEAGLHGRLDAHRERERPLHGGAGARRRRSRRRSRRRWSAALGYDVATFLRTPAELAAVAAQRPFPDEDLGEAHGVYVGFLKEPLGAAQHDLVHGFRTPTDEFAVGGREVWWLCRVRSSESEFSGARLKKALAVRATFRNLTTVRALAARLAG